MKPFYFQTLHCKELIFIYSSSIKSFCNINDSKMQKLVIFKWLYNYGSVVICAIDPNNCVILIQQNMCTSIRKLVGAQKTGE